MNAHIINCDYNDFINLFIENGSLGVGIIITGITPQGLSMSCRMSYSMYADMKTVREGDLIFIHAGQNIYGAFCAKTEFLEDPNTPQRFISRNIHYYPVPGNPQSGWRNNINAIPNLGYTRRISISSFIDDQNRNRCYENGMNSTEVFNLKAKGKIWTIPERWKYSDTARIVRPLMIDEAYELLKAIEKENVDNPNRHNIRSSNLDNYIPIEFILNPNIIENEKIIEGWLVGNLGRNPILDEAIGPFSSFGNNLPAGYLKFMDVFGYQLLDSGERIYKVIEVKRNRCVFPDDIVQLSGYTNWVSENIASGDYKYVEGILVASGFENDCIEFVNNYNNMDRKIRLISFDYNPPNYDTLNIQRVA